MRHRRRCVTALTCVLIACAGTFVRGDASARDESAIARDLADADRAVAARPDAPPVYMNRAHVLDAMRRYERAVTDYSKVIELLPTSPAAFQHRGEDQFRLGRFKASVADFDQVLALDPDQAPYHWQRGISLYYAGEFDKAARQFELHKTVNPEDVENAAWHFLCVARASGIEAARRRLIPIHGDSRVPMAEVHEMFAGRLSPRDVLAAANAGRPEADDLRQRLLYAHLYIGLFHEAEGRPAQAAEEIRLAAEKYAGDDYMSDVARAHHAALDQAAAATTRPTTSPPRR